MLVTPGTARAASSAIAARAISILGGGLRGVLQVERHGLRRGGGLGEAGVRVLGHDLGHRDRALGQCGEPGGIDGGGGDDGGLLAEEHAQAEVVALGPLDVLGLAEAALHGERGAGDQHGIGGVGSAARA